MEDINLQLSGLKLKYEKPYAMPKDPTDLTSNWGGSVVPWTSSAHQPKLNEVTFAYEMSGILMNTDHYDFIHNAYKDMVEKLF